MLRGAWNLWTILHPFQKSELRLKRDLNPKDVNGNTLPRQRGWKFYYNSEPFHRLTLPELKTLANTVNFKAKIGVQAGNYAFGEVEAESEHCIKNFRNAIDEYPKCWHIHEGLGNWYEDHDQREKAIKCYAEAIKVHHTNQPSVAYNHWSLISVVKEEKGDSKGAIEALKTGALAAMDSEAYRYWDAMSKIHEKTGNGNEMAEIYKEAIENHPSVSKYFWKAIAKVYGQGGVRELQFNAYRDAIKADPENADEYGELIRTLAEEIKDLCIWQPVEYMLDLGPKIDPTNAYKYYREKGYMQMCRR
jgi:tetratricopeptide (TPR) repeat protein